MTGFHRFFMLLLLAVACCRAFATDAGSSIVFGQIGLAGGELPLDWHLVLKEVETAKTVTVPLTRRETAVLIYDFAAPVPPGKYYFYMLEAFESTWEPRIAEKSQYFELKPGAVLYLGNWTIKLGKPQSKTIYNVKYDVNEVGLFAAANPAIERSRYAIGVLGKPAVPLKAQ